jgi:long-chain acyl-CoA synthetase
MALTTETANKWKELTGSPITEGYGLTETSPVVSSNQCNAVQYGTVGRPVPETECKVVDENGNDLPTGEAGELLIRGPQVMKGYRSRGLV